MDIQHQDRSAEVTSVLDLPTVTKVDSVDVEMRVSENNSSQVEGNTKERDLERASEKTEPRDEDLVVAQQISVQRPEPQSDNDSSATCSADEDVDGEPERQRWDSLDVHSVLTLLVAKSQDGAGPREYSCVILASKGGVFAFSTEYYAFHLLTKNNCVIIIF